MTGVVIRPLRGLAEREACVALQDRVWGPGFADRVPASILMIVQETGGVASGAFDGDRLIGFVFGVTGIRDGRPVHWSDMLAVEEGWRGRGIGFRLKLHQRELLLDRGVETARWTFDPLEARNAHLNLRRLGAIAYEYRRDLYGRSESPLHAGIGTDRLVVRWPIASDRVSERVAAGEARRAPVEGRASHAPSAAGPVAPSRRGTLPVVNPVGPGDPRRPGTGLIEPDSSAVRIAIPGDIQALKRSDPDAGLAWRANVRAAFEWAFDAGYTALDLQRGSGGQAGVAHYVAVRGFDPVG
ncbi:MAG: hypothetical protein R3314_05560 [Longimicrobiales bacterium]|nr:hypothetical protein [Longimicrobiales bacterium]